MTSLASGLLGSSLAAALALLQSSASPPPGGPARGRGPAPMPPVAAPGLDFDEHVAALRKKLPSSAFTIVLQPPFVVVGDEPAEAVKRRAVDTVKWAVDRLKRDFFQADPDKIIDVWLFKDADSYRTHA